MSSFYAGSFFVLISAAAFAMIPIFALYAYEGGVSVATLLFLRFLIAGVLFFSYLFVKKSGRLKLTPQQLIHLLLLGCFFYTMQSILYFSSVAYIPASLAALLLYTFPIYVSILSYLVDREPINGKTITSILISMSGLALVLGTSFGEVEIVGVLLALGAAVSYALYIVLGNRTVQHLPPLVVSGYVSLFATCSLFVVGLATGGLALSFAPSAWWAVLGVAVVCTVIAFFTFFRGLSLVGSTRASVLSMIEPVVTSLFSALLFAERLSWLQMMGGAIVLIGASLIVTAREQAKVEQSG
ncbi:DMT family transporter [Brevibacillus humidisoli]|uniref:DMT family transporter n=1 Tax=Brevibacillus humidisoli TaxID=2895522 RepID=UPI001E328910|nr:DMT family transporter [Brevibacillus humidisoli]UFJ41067.1 DMT family transporter [Brevibacillus humidisoli]